MVAVRLGVVVMGAGVLLGCSKETPPAAEEPRSASNAAAPQAPPNAAADGSTAPAAAAAPAAEPEIDPKHPPAAKFAEPEFDLAISPPASALKAGQAGAVEIVLAAKAPYHVNDKYPIKLKLNEKPGVKYDSLTITKDAVKLGRPAGKTAGDFVTATVPVSLTADAAGKRTVSGRLAFSVCTEDKCLMEKRDLVLDVVVE
jgi:hypothetical protein